MIIVNFFKVIENKNFYGVHDCLTVTCNNVKFLIELLKSAYCTIYSNNNYLLEFDKNFRNTIIKSFGEKAVSFDDKNEKLTVRLTAEEDSKVDIHYPSITNLLNQNIEDIDLKESSYLIH